MKVYVVTVEQHYANHFYVDKVFADRGAAEEYHALNPDTEVYTREVIGATIVTDIRGRTRIVFTEG